MERIIKYLLIFLLLIPAPCLSAPQTTSSTTGTAMIALVRADYNDTTTTYFTAAEMLQFLNDGVKDISMKTLSVQTIEDINLIADTVEYAPVGAYIKIISVVYDDGTNIYGLKPGDPALAGLSIDETDIDAPVYWYEFDGIIGVYPPLSSVTSEKITVYMALLPAVIITSEDVPTPAIYDNALKYYMLARMALKDKNTALYTALMSQYNNELGLFRKDLKVSQENAD